MATYNKFDCFTGDVMQKVHNMNSDSIKVMLSDVSPVRTNTVKANITEIAAGFGYTAGGVLVPFVSGADASGTYKLVLSPGVFTGSGGSIAQFRYAVLYNSTPVSGNLISWWDYGAEVIITNGNSFTVQLDQTNGVFSFT